MNSSSAAEALLLGQTHSRSEESFEEKLQAAQKELPQIKPSQHLLANTHLSHQQVPQRRALVDLGERASDAVLARYNPSQALREGKRDVKREQAFKLESLPLLHAISLHATVWMVGQRTLPARSHLFAACVDLILADSTVEERYRELIPDASFPVSASQGFASGTLHYLYPNQEKTLCGRYPVRGSMWYHRQLLGKVSCKACTKKVSEAERMRFDFPTLLEDVLPHPFQTASTVLVKATRGGERNWGVVQESYHEQRSQAIAQWIAKSAIDSPDSEFTQQMFGVHLKKKPGDYRFEFTVLKWISENLDSPDNLQAVAKEYFSPQSSSS